MPDGDKRRMSYLRRSAKSTMVAPKTLNAAAVPHLMGRLQKFSLRTNRNGLYSLLVNTIVELTETIDCEAKELEATVEIILDALGTSR